LTVDDTGSILRAYANGYAGQKTMGYNRSATTLSLNRLAMGALIRTTTSDYTAMTVQRVLVYNLRSAAEKNAVGRFLAEKYNLPWTDIA
jgi:hypothetical protein